MPTQRTFMKKKKLRKLRFRNYDEVFYKIGIPKYTIAKFKLMEKF
tara:strand:+ start:212 stop:346 length:135 start_codon:yes stop_codon:yes gene_type:complete